MSITLILIIITVIISLLAMKNDELMYKLIFHPYTIAKYPAQWYRAITCGFIHADFMHLAFNMLSLFMFGELVEKSQYEGVETFQTIFGDNANIFFLLLYFSALVVCIIPTYFSHKNQYNYRSLGASGAVSGIVFVGIFLQPTIPVGIFFLPAIPGFIFAPIYLGLTIYLSKKGPGNINHSAHLWGALYGIIFVIVAAKFAGMEGHNHMLESFLNQVKYYTSNKRFFLF
jgi:membrane associated rhomboid family serine protease